MGRGVASNSPPLYVRGLMSFIDLFCHKLLNYLLIGFLYVNLKMCMYCSSLCPRGGTAIYGLYRYVPL